MRQRRRQVTERPANNVFSYYVNNRSSQDVARRRNDTSSRDFSRLKHVPSVIAFVVIIVSMVSISLVDSRPRVSIVANENGRGLQREPKVYEDYATEVINRSALNKSKFFFDSRPVVADLKKQFPEIADVVVTMPLVGQRPIVRIAVSSPAFILAATNGQYYVNDKGLPLAKVSDVPVSIPGLQTITDQTSVPVELGENMLPMQTVEFIHQLLLNLSASEVSVSQVTLPLELHEVQVRLNDQPYYVRYNSLEDARVQTGTFLAVKNRVEQQNAIPKEYIDVRVPERAYYR